MFADPFPLESILLTVILSVAQDHRLSLHNIHLATIAMEDHIKWYGPELVISGGDESGSWRNSTSFAAQMWQLSQTGEQTFEAICTCLPGHSPKAECPSLTLTPSRHHGYEIEVPNPSGCKPAFLNLHVRGWVLLVTADNAAATEMLSCYKKACGPSTFAPCRGCLCVQV